MKSKGFKIRSLASAINQTQGSLGIHLGLGVQNEPLKQQVQSPLFSEWSRRMQGRESVGKKELQSVEQNQYFIRYTLPFVFLSYKLDFEIKRNAFNMSSVFASCVSPTIHIIPLRLWRYWAQCDTKVINQIIFFILQKAAGIEQSWTLKHWPERRL